MSDQSTTIPATPWFYAIVLPETGQVLYNGDSLASAANCLVSGSWHGRGLTMAEARAAAWHAASMAELAKRQSPAQGSSVTSAANGVAAVGIDRGRQANDLERTGTLAGRKSRPTLNHGGDR